MPFAPLMLICLFIKYLMKGMNSCKGSKIYNNKNIILFKKFCETVEIKDLFISHQN